jgi:hypothetical protein
MADEAVESSGNVDTSMAGLLEKIAKDPALEYLDETPSTDSVTEETTEEPAEAAEVVEEEPAEDPKRDKVQERIDKLTAQKKSAEEEATALRSKVEELSKTPTKEYVPVPTKENPLADIQDHAALKIREDTVERLREHCQLNPDGFSYNREGTEVFVDANEVRKTLVETDRLLRKEIPARKQWLETSASVTAQAKIDFPWMFDAKTKEYQLAQNIEQNFPEIKKLPSYKQLIGLLILGENTLNNSKAKKGPVKPGAKLPTPPSSGSGSTKTNTTPTTPMKPKSGSKSDAVNYIMDTVLKNMKF